jgi:hypothetical protein
VIVPAFQTDVVEAEQDFAAACRHSLAHGNLLTLRYLTPDLPWQAAMSSPAGVLQLRRWIERLFSLLMRAAESALRPLAVPQETVISALPSSNRLLLVLIIESCLRGSVCVCCELCGCMAGGRLKHSLS